ncbi:bifunctional DNA primase/polymerase [Streptomyces sp. NPDC057197]|uniref:bifunctional DNA primase/polymerase n=1 Tax=Streptomyces sp. NPDC057197 TaxID=3346045 RepID=UPI00362D5BB1
MATTARKPSAPAPAPAPASAPAPALTHALTAAARGLAVIPLSPTKHPALRSPHHPASHDGANHPATRRADGAAPPGGAPDTTRRQPCRGECGALGHGVYDASSDPARIRDLFAAAPRATGYGIACGVPPHHLIGVDLDTKTGTDALAALRELARRHRFPLPATVVVLTPSGGRHLWFSGPPDVAVPNSAGRLAPGIDIRGTGGYLIGPGSRTHHGTYALAPGTAHLAPAPCPPLLLRLLVPPPRRTPPPSPGRRTAHGLVRFVLDAPEGQRNTRLFWAACRAYESGLGPALHPLLLDAALTTGLSRPEAHSTLMSAARATGHHP